MCPLETSLPRTRLKRMLDVAGVSFLIADGAALGRIPQTGATAIDLDAERANIAAQSPENPSVPVHGENLAYVVFTSGSTGRPKGVMVSHRSLLAAPAAWEQAYDLRRPLPRHLQAAGFAFDVFTGDWVRALTTGGTLVACPSPVSLDPAALTDLIRRERIECLELVPALASALATHLERQGEDLGTVRLLAVGSDTLRGSLYRRLWRLIETRRASGQLLRADRGDDRQYVLRGAAERPRSRRTARFRSADRCWERARTFLMGWRAGSGGCGRRAVHRRVRCGTRLRR